MTDDSPRVSRTLTSPLLLILFKCSQTLSVKTTRAEKDYCYVSVVYSKLLTRLGLAVSALPYQDPK